jgi:murein DD-endopeptidase MepM/ murein hydrolase activator NlpD
LTLWKTRCRVAASSEWGDADLNRRSSPINYDYKPPAGKQVKKKGALPWFAAGLGLPLIGIAFVLSQAKMPEEDLSIPAPGNVAVPSIVKVDDRRTADKLIELPAKDEEIVAVSEPTPEPDIEQATIEPVSVAETSPQSPEFHPPLALPPEFDRMLLTVKRGDTLDRLFRRNNLSIGDLAMMLKVPEAAPHLKKLIPGDELTIEHDDESLISLYRELDLTSALKVTKEESGFSAELIDRPIEVRKKLAFGRISSSLYESAMEAGLTDKTVMNLAGIFAWDVDFVLDIRTGDDYYILVEELYQDGEYVGDGEIIAAEFNNNGRTIQAIRFIDSDGRSDYFTPDGQSVRKAFLRAPVDFRVSSSFNPNRRHPVLKTVRPHRGTDYAAPSGTPIKASGDGKVIFRGVKSGYGNVVILQHGGNITTLYAHMSKFASKVRAGTRVRQGQTIGYVGKTGLVTGVHLHYEYRLNGVHRNPRTVSLPQAEPIKEQYRDEFLASVEPILDELLQYKRTQVASLSVD